MGSPTVVIIGKAGNKFILGAEDDVFAAKLPVTAEAILGKESILGLTGFRYRMVKGAMMSFLKPESLQNYLKEMDELVKRLLLIKTKETDTIKAVTFMKKLTFTIAFNILFGIKDECTREALFEDFNLVFKAIWSLPVNFPGTVYWRGLKARSRIVDRILPILGMKSEELSSRILSPTSDVISSMLALRDQNQQPIGHHTIIDNCIT
ncbi:taxadiene 5-alpha hydroxylase-like [Fagus crenata]